MKRKNVSPGEPPASKRANLSVATVGGPSSSTGTPKMPKNKQASVSTPTAVSTPSVEKPSSKRSSVKLNTSSSTPISLNGSIGSNGSVKKAAFGKIKPGEVSDMKLSTPVMSAANRQLNGILKKTPSIKGSPSTSTPPGTPTRNISFSVSDVLKKLLEKFIEKSATPQELDDLLAHFLRNSGKGLAQCLDELRRNICSFDKSHFPLITQIAEIPWSGLDNSVFKSLKKFYLNLASYHPCYTKTIIRCLLRQFMPMMEGEKILQASPIVNLQIHDFLKKFLRKHPGEKKELLKQIVSMFPFYKLSSDKHSCYVRGLLEMYGYLADQQKDLIEIIFEKSIHLDAGISRTHIRSYAYYEEKEQKERQSEDERDDKSPEKSITMHGYDEEEDEEDKEEEQEAYPILTSSEKRLGENIDLCMLEIFKFLRNETSGGEAAEGGNLGSEEGSAEKVENSNLNLSVESSRSQPFSLERRQELEQIFLKVFLVYILPSDKIQHVQYSIFYLASKNKKFAIDFLKLNWNVFTAANKASIIRQSAMSYLSGFLCRSLVVDAKLLKKWLTKIVVWIQAYMGRDNSHSVDYMVVNLAVHGPLYSACQALFYTIAFRHKDLVDDDDTSFLRGLGLNQMVVHPLNPLRVVTPAVLKQFSKTVAHYQITYCNNIMERNNRITLPVSGLSSGGSSTLEGKPLLLDNYFPFDPYLLPSTRHYVDGIYRKFETIFTETDSESEEEETNEKEDDFLDLSSSNLLERTRTISNSSSSRRSRTTSFTEILLRDLETA